MKRKSVVFAIIGMLFVALFATAGGAVAGSLITSSKIKDGTIKAVDLNKGLNTKINKVGQTGPKGDTGATGATGPQGPKGADGSSSGVGATGPQGPKGDTGATGPAGAKGADGVNAQALPYGIAEVKVSRGGAAATTWASYSTTLGGPVGDTTGGTFRFTCNIAQAPCTVSLTGSSTKTGAKVYPRVNITTVSLNGGPVGQCEYGDGPQSGALTSTPLALVINIGGSDDCGLNGPAGDLNQITVPAGYYTVDSAFQFAS